MLTHRSSVAAPPADVPFGHISTSSAGLAPDQFSLIPANSKACTACATTRSLYGVFDTPFRREEDGSVLARRDCKIEQLKEDGTMEWSRREASDGLERPLPRQAEGSAWIEGLDGVASFEDGKMGKLSEDMETVTRRAETLRDRTGRLPWCCTRWILSCATMRSLYR
jgi:hypothetical protein